MSYNILRAGKINSRKKITEAASHNFRTRMQGNIEASQTPLNQILWNPMAVDTTVAADLQKKLTSHYEALGVKEKKDNVLMLEFVVSASPEFFKDMKPDRVQLWAEHQLDFMKNEFGDNVQMAVLHLDEKTPHLHFLLSTEIKTVKAYKNRHGSCSKENWSLNAKRWGPKFLVDLHTRHAEHNKDWGLLRGKLGSEARHTPVKQYYRTLHGLKTRLESKLDQVDMIPELIEAIEVLSEAIIEMDPPNHRLAKMAKLATGIAKKSRGGVPPTPPTQKGVGGG